MNISALLKAKHVGVKSFRTNLSKFIRNQKPYIIMDRTQPQEFVIPYNEMIELVEMIEELSDRELLKQIAEGRNSYHKGGWIPVSRLWQKLGLE